jgi:hypothetical protein
VVGQPVTLIQPVAFSPSKVPAFLPYTFRRAAFYPLKISILTIENLNTRRWRGGFRVWRRLEYLNAYYCVRQCLPFAVRGGFGAKGRGGGAGRLGMYC